LARNFSSPNFDLDNDDLDNNDLDNNDVEHETFFARTQRTPFPADPSTPSLPIILLSAASGISAGIIALYITYRTFGLAIEWSVAIAVLCLSAALGCTGALLSTLTGSRAAMSNIAFSCGLILITLLFFALCTLVGAIAATFILTL